MDKLVALSLAFDLYRASGRLRARRDKLKRLVAGDEQLTAKLSSYLKPPPHPENRKWREQERRFKRRQAAREAKNAQRHAEWKDYLVAKLESHKQHAADRPGTFFNTQHYLFEHLRKGSRNNHRWTEYNWQNLVPAFGVDVARYYRDTAVVFWRHNVPKLVSEGFPANQTAHATIFGLVGLEIEAHETEGWPAGLSDVEVRFACRYASFELNGFTTWFPDLFATYPDVVSEFLLAEIAYELGAERADAPSHYILSDISWSGQWAWDKLARPLYELLKIREPINTGNFARIIKIIQGSPLSNDEIAALASEKSKTIADLPRLGWWLAVWTGVAPSDAIPFLEERLKAIEGREDRTTLAMNFITALVGSRRSDAGNARAAYRTPEHLKQLYLLMNEHIRREDDIDRANGGVYSPELRDDAQDGRNSLFEMILKVPGKEGFIALTEIAEAFPDRPWLARYPKQMAEQDGDVTAWSPSQVRDFHDKLECTPSNHRELAELAVMRLEDLKDDLENGDSSLAGILKTVQRETDMRKFIGHELRDKAQGRYTIPQEEELADGKKPDLRFHGVGFDGPVPVELKLADASWSGAALLERLENQLCGDYLRDNKSSHGLFALVYRGEQETWKLPDGTSVNFNGLIEALQRHWIELSPRFPQIDDVVVLGIDLTKRGA